MFSGGETLHQIQAGLGKLYDEANKNLSEDHILNRIDENSGFLTKTLLEQIPGDDWFIKTLSWLFALCNKLQIDIQESILRRYPGICPYCLASSCICYLTNKFPRQNKSLQEKGEELKNKYSVLCIEIQDEVFHPSIDEIGIKLKTIYRVNVLVWNSDKSKFFAKLSEERAEIHRLCRQYRRARSRISALVKENLEKEIADYFAWLLAIWTLEKLHEPDFSFQEAFTDKYSAGCPYCTSCPCQCSTERQLTMQTQPEVRKVFSEVADPIEELRGQLIEIIDLLKQSPELEKAANAVNVPKRLDRGAALAVLDAVRKIFESTNKFGKEAFNLIKMIGNAREYLETNPFT